MKLCRQNSAYVNEFFKIKTLFNPSFFVSVICKKISTFVRWCVKIFSPPTVSVLATMWWSTFFTCGTIRRSRCYCCDRELNESHWTMRYRARLILSQCYVTDLPLFLRPRPQNRKFSAYPILPGRRGSCNPSEKSSAICLLYCGQLPRHLSNNKCFWLFQQRRYPSSNS